MADENIDPGVRMVIWFQGRISDLEKENQHLVDQLSGNLRAIKSEADEVKNLRVTNNTLNQNLIGLKIASIQCTRLLRESKTTIRMLNRQISELSTPLESMKPKPRRKTKSKK